MSATATQAWRAGGARRAAVTGLALAALAASFAADLATGPALLPVADVLRVLGGLSDDRMLEAIVLQLRLPIAVMAALVGAALGLSGAVMQTILNNPLASSYTLGISAGAGFGAALAILAGAALPVPEAWAIPIAAFAFAGLACAMVAGVGRLRGATPELLVLAGIACLFLFQSLLSLLQFLASPEALQQIVFWLFGSLMRASLPKAAVVGGVLVVVLPLLLRDALRLTALRLGDDRAMALGVRVGALRLRCFAVVSLLTGVAVAFVGTIGFVGLVAPHIARMLVGEDQRHLLPASAAFGALLLSVASVASKVIVPGTVFPIGIVTALVGVPFFAWLVLAAGPGLVMRIGVHGLCVRFGRAEVLRGIDLEVAPGEVVAVLGANGSGKSTLLRSIAGVQAHQGRLSWNGAEARPASGIGYMPQDNATRVGLTVFEVVLLGRLRSLALRVGEADLAAAEAALAELGIGDLAQRRLGELSGGQRQLAFLAQVLAGEPQALLLDEPTSALDIAHQVQVLDLLAAATRRRGLTTLAVLHDLNAAARFADRIALLCDGRIACVGAPEAVLEPERLRTVYGVEVAVLPGPDGLPMVLPLGMTGRKNVLF